MIAADTDLDALFKRLHLANARRMWRGLVERAERESWSYRDFLTLLATEEIAHRQQTRLARLTRRALFPRNKSRPCATVAEPSGLAVIARRFTCVRGVDDGLRRGGVTSPPTRAYCALR